MQPNRINPLDTRNELINAFSILGTKKVTKRKI